MIDRNESPITWLKRQFEFEYCPECGGDEHHHTVCYAPTGTYFARCDYPRSMDTKWELHPLVAAYQKHSNDPLWLRKHVRSVLDGYFGGDR